MLDSTWRAHQRALSLLVWKIQTLQEPVSCLCASKVPRPRCLASNNSSARECDSCKCKLDGDSICVRVA